MPTATTFRTVSEIAAEIRKDWVKTNDMGMKVSAVNFAAKPYLAEMAHIGDINEVCGFGGETGKTMVLYFLCNAGTWRGATAKRIKAELKAMVK
jgi:hypothetical protein